jgi:Lon protease-like protein
MSDNKMKISDLPSSFPVFPLSGVLLLPRGQLPLNIFEPRYLQMLDDALGRGRYLGMIQPLDENSDQLAPVGCLGRISSFSEAEDGRMIISVTGICRFSVVEELPVTTPYRQVNASFDSYVDDLIVDAGSFDVNREGLIDVLRRYLDASGLSVDWESVESSSNEALVNSLSMISPFGAREKQAMLEASSLGERNEILIALTEMALARGLEPGSENDHPFQ